MSEQQHHNGWIVEKDFDLGGSYHMLRDEELALAMRDDASALPVLRLYTWQPYTVSLGFQQKEQDINKDLCEELGIGVVRRPTGGRAVYHSEELTYAVIMRADPAESIAAVHNKIAEALLNALQPIAGGELRMTSARDTMPVRESYQNGKPTNIACFASTSRYEITYRGRKLMGSAQRRFGDAVLQHGSILMGPEHLRLAHLLNAEETLKAKTLELMQRETVTLNEIAGRDLSTEEVAETVQQGFKL
jgi:lipoyl(octanoyl) transferase